MKIYNKEPRDWRDLQDKVAEVLNKSNYLATSPKNIDTVRGRVEVDVWARRSIPMPAIILCECKYWETAVPQTIIHAFRSVVEDAGAHIGIIISKSGFQSGSYKVDKFTNIFLTDWGEFLNMFEDEWLKFTIKDTVSLSRLLYHLSKPTSLRYVDQFDKFPEEEKKQVCKMENYYFDIAFSSSMSKLYDNPIDKEINKELLYAHIKECEKIFSCTFNSYNDFFKFMKNEIKNGLNFYDDIYI